MKHPSNALLAEFLNDTLDQEQEKVVADHLDSCSVCQAHVECIIGETFNTFSNQNTHSLASEITPPSPTLDWPQLDLGSRFLIREELARGGMGVVYRGFDRELLREVAIKVSKIDDQQNGSVRFHREAQISGQLQHPGMIPVHGLEKLDDGRTFIVMKLVEGQTLLSSIQSGETSLDRLLEVFGCICRTMAFAHSKNCIHRDLKPDNIMVGVDSEVFVMDWGLAKKLSQSTTGQSTSGQLTTTTSLKQTDQESSQTKGNVLQETMAGDIFGTPAYMPPEQALGEATGKRSDVFALGGILYEILTGHAPFNDLTASSMSRRSFTYDFKRAYGILEQSGADEPLISLVKSCLASDPNDRPEDAASLDQQFADYIEDRSRKLKNLELEKARENERLLFGKKRARQSTWFAIALVTALLTAGIVGYLFLAEIASRSNEPQEDSSRFSSTNQEAAKFHEGCLKVRDICYKSLHSPEIRLALPDRLTDEFAEAFREIGVEPDDVSDELVTRLSSSGSSAYLLHGLLVWHEEIGRESRRFGARSDDAKLQAWLRTLLEKAEQNPFRVSVLSAYLDGDDKLLGPLLDQDESDKSLESVLLCTRAVSVVQGRKTKLNYLLRAQQAFPSEFQIKWKLATALNRYHEDELEQSISVGLACQALQPKNPSVLMNLGAVYIELKNYDRAIQLFQQTAELAPGFIDSKYNLANAYFLNKQFDQALTSCEDVLAVSENHSRALLLQATIFEQQGRDGDAILALKKSVKKTPEYVDAHRQLADIYLAQDNRAGAITHIELLVKIQPSNLKYQTELAALYIQANRLDEAEPIRLSILEQDPSDFRTLASLANQYLRSKQPQKSEKLLRKAILNGSNHRLIQLELAKALLAQKANAIDKRVEAIQILKQMKVTAPKNVEAAYLLKKELKAMDSEVIKPTTDP